MDNANQDQASVLVVEDDDDISHMLTFMLKRQQYRVSVALDGLVAKTHIESNSPPNLILLDLMLPFIDRFELIGIIRATAGWQSVPIIMLTAKTQEKDAVRALDAGANDYMHKPFAPNELLARVRRYIKSPP
jgi:DNA-binding response OmpR family regulator